MASMRDAALAYAKRDLPVFPVWSVLQTDNGPVCACGRASCQNIGKHPLGSIVPNGLSDASTDVAKIEHWWTLKPDANIGLATGGFVVIDVDPRHGGDRSLVELVTKYGALPKTRRARTGGGGEHIYFRPPTGGTIASGNNKVAAGIDVKASGGYVLAPPSLHESGNRYAWIDSVPAVEMPAWLIDRLQEPRVREAAPSEHWRQLVSVGANEGGRGDPAPGQHRLPPYGLPL